jgi:hypothetical protein
MRRSLGLPFRAVPKGSKSRCALHWHRLQTPAWRDDSEGSMRGGSRFAGLRGLAICVSADG